MLRLVLVLGALVVLPVAEASAQCSRIGEQVCQGGFLYTCQACGSEKCLILSGEQCQVPVD
jgi:Zn finger protein HypA/HybF involved in hydrogenase expression